MNQKDAIVNYLAKRPGEWVPSHALCKTELDGTYIPPRGERTARDLAQAGKHRIGDYTYFVERRIMPVTEASGKRNNYAFYRVTGKRCEVERYEIADGVAKVLPKQSKMFV